MYNKSLETNYGRRLFIPCFLGKVGGLGPISSTFYHQHFYYVLLAEKNPKAKNLDLDGLEGKGKNSKERKIKNMPPIYRFGLIQFYNITLDPRSYWGF